MEQLVGGVVPADSGKVVDVLGHTYTYKAYGPGIIFAFATLDLPDTGIPLHIHPDQDEFILVQEGTYRVQLGNSVQTAQVGDLIILPRGIPHSYHNHSTSAVARALFWVTPEGQLRELFDALSSLQPGDDVVAISARHGVNFLPPAES
jgi:hypothetical protein